LPSIGNALSANTVLPVVDTSGVAVTAKVTAGNIANYTLTEAGNLLPPALLANLAYSVVNAAQPNITSVGTLNINTLTISGGTNGQYLQTDGTGNLAWVAGGGSGNGAVGGSNTQIQFNDAGSFGGQSGFTFNKISNVLATPGNITATGNIIGASLTTSGVLSVTGNANIGNIGTSSVVSATSVTTTPTAYANLIAVAGARAFINNGNLAAAGNFGAQVIGGGSNIVPVWSNGTNWYIG
jgi:hypothetical protein